MVQLLDPHSSINFLHLKFPIICRKIDRGENIFYLDTARMSEYFNLGGADAEILPTSLCSNIVSSKKPNSLRSKVGPMRRALEFKSLIESGVVKNQSELAAYLGKSRAWVSRVIGTLKAPIK